MTRFGFLKDLGRFGVVSLLVAVAFWVKLASADEGAGNSVEVTPRFRLCELQLTDGEVSPGILADRHLQFLDEKLLSHGSLLQLADFLTFRLTTMEGYLDGVEDKSAFAAVGGSQQPKPRRPSIVPVALMGPLDLNLLVSSYESLIEKIMFHSGGAELPEGTKWTIELIRRIEREKIDELKNNRQRIQSWLKNNKNKLFIQPIPIDDSSIESLSEYLEYFSAIAGAMIDPYYTEDILVYSKYAYQYTYFDDDLSKKVENSIMVPQDEILSRALIKLKSFQALNPPEIRMLEKAIQYFR
jgi:hypothetical protein